MNAMTEHRPTILALIFALALPALALAGEQEVIVQADQLYLQRADSSKAQEGLDVLRAGAAEYPTSYGIHWRVARICWWIAEGTSDTSIKKALGREGWDAAAVSVETDSDGLEGHYWYVLALGEYSNGISILKAIAQGLDGKFSDHLDLVLAADEDYDDGGALRAKGKYWFSLPRFMRSFPKSLERLERSNELVPNHPRTLFYLAETELALGNEERARTYVEASLAASSWPDRPEWARVSAWARTFQAGLD